jgi:hypothetical protein
VADAQAMSEHLIKPISTFRTAELEGGNGDALFVPRTRHLVVEVDFGLCESRRADGLMDECKDPLPPPRTG